MFNIIVRGLVLSKRNQLTFKNIEIVTVCKHKIGWKWNWHGKCSITRIEFLSISRKVVWPWYPEELNFTSPVAISGCCGWDREWRCRIVCKLQCTTVAIQKIRSRKLFVMGWAVLPEDWKFIGKLCWWHFLRALFSPRNIGVFEVFKTQHSRLLLCYPVKKKTSQKYVVNWFEGDASVITILAIASWKIACWGLLRWRLLVRPVKGSQFKKK